jgi:hypothetical protein
MSSAHTGVSKMSKIRGDPRLVALAHDTRVAIVEALQSADEMSKTTATKGGHAGGALLFQSTSPPLSLQLALTCPGFQRKLPT